MAFGLAHARLCFQSFSRREYFTLEVVQGLCSLALGFLFAGMLGHW
jgi:hypothetical protein